MVTNIRYKAGDIIEANIPLDELFVGKFQRLSNEVYQADLVPKRQVKQDTRMIFVFADATDVSGSFPLAQENNLRVFKDAMGGYAVAVAGVPDDTLMNIAPTVMGDKKQVKEWLTSYLNSHKG
jgi:hypothetical protein